MGEEIAITIEVEILTAEALRHRVYVVIREVLVLGNSDSWARLQEAFEGALALGSGKDREEYLERTLADFPVLLEEVRDMLLAHEDTPPLQIEKRFVSEGDE